MLEATFWGLFGGGALLVGALLGLYVRASPRVIAAVMALGAGVLISAVAFDLTAEAYDAGGATSVVVGMALGSCTYYAGDRILVARGAHDRKRSRGQRPAECSSGTPSASAGGGAALALGALLDGIPESAAIGLSLLGGGGVGVAMVAAVFLSNIPEGWSSAAGMRHDGRTPGSILGLWAGIVLASGVSALLGYVVLDAADPVLIGGVQAFAAGAIITMLADTMVPEAYEEGGDAVGLITALGFTLAFLIDKVG
ncbi:ZIP family metal transporter [Solicola gregarius]|uniref:ZIP family zinc transporter n=1 Tax=Solicola gregarius TaxID=2908642 RepID=A0AA46YJZ3_9ACTN|nr:ZIP family zinc transporter [Solicola gregarius]UYM04887.1 ZIP family zinc transporter [Solicola gregarius]